MLLSAKHFKKSTIDILSSIFLFLLFKSFNPTTKHTKEYFHLSISDKFTNAPFD
jgi:hypothetical protein